MTHCPMFFSLGRDNPPLGTDALAHQWPQGLLYAYPPFSLLHPPLTEDPARECSGDPGGSKLAPHAMVLRDRTTPERNSLGAPHLERPVGAGTRRLVSPLRTGPETVGKAPERAEFRALGLPDPVIQTLESARAPSTCVAYAFRWGKFASWCEVHQVDPLVSTSQHIL